MATFNLNNKSEFRVAEELLNDDRVKAATCIRTVGGGTDIKALAVWYDDEDEQWVGTLVWCGPLDTCAEHDLVFTASNLDEAKDQSLDKARTWFREGLTRPQVEIVRRKTWDSDWVV